MTRLPIRARLTIAFALAMVVVLAAAGLFVYLSLREDLSETIDEGLTTRADAVGRLVRGAPLPLREGVNGSGRSDSEGFAQLLASDGRVIDTTGGVRGPALNPAELRRAARGRIFLERAVAGIEGPTRLFAQPVRRGSPTGTVVAVGQSLDDRNEVLSGLAAAFVIGGPVAVALASLLGYGLATIGLRPIEAIRRRAAEVSLTRDEERLPLPAAQDEVYRLGETLNEMLDRLRQSFERERRFVADASHELRTPIAVVKTELEGALRSGDYGPSVRESLRAADEECDRLGQLAEDLLIIARASEGRLPVRAERLDVATLLEGVCQRFAERSSQSGRTMRSEVPDGLELLGDPLRLRQALANLVDNALRHGEGDVVLRASRAGGGVRLEVADEGEGFGPGVAARAFERFARGDEARTRGGAGLGLAIVRAVVDAHGGASEIVAGSGATVRLWLPDTLPAGPPAAGSTDGPGAEHQGVTNASTEVPEPGDTPVGGKW